MELRVLVALAVQVALIQAVAVDPELQAEQGQTEEVEL
jgi:hypothetical protein